MKFPVNVAPACKLIMSPGCAALIAACKLFPAKTSRTMPACVGIRESSNTRGISAGLPDGEGVGVGVGVGTGVGVGVGVGVTVGLGIADGTQEKIALRALVGLIEISDSAHETATL